jgi:hypothetical protein
MELPVVRPASGAAPTRSFLQTACQALQESQSEGEKGAGALLTDGPIDRAAWEGSRGRPALTVIPGRPKARGHFPVVGGRVRLVANAGSMWPTCDQAAPRPAGPSRAAEVIVLSGCGDRASMGTADAGVEIASATGTQSPACRGPPRSARKPAGRGAAAPYAAADEELVVPR